jgi:hypothetical protein
MRVIRSRSPVVSCSHSGSGKSNAEREMDVKIGNCFLSRNDFLKEKKVGTSVVGGPKKEKRDESLAAF